MGILRFSGGGACIYCAVGETPAIGGATMDLQRHSGTRMQNIGLIAGPVLAIGLLLFFDLDPGRPAVTRTAAVALLMARMVDDGRRFRWRPPRCSRSCCSRCSGLWMAKRSRLSISTTSFCCLSAVSWLRWPCSAGICIGGSHCACSCGAAFVRGGFSWDSWCPRLFCRCGSPIRRPR